MEKSRFSKMTTLSGQTKNEVGQGSSRFLESRKVPHQISPSFKMLVSNFRLFLSEMKQKLDAEESKLLFETDERRMQLEIETLALANGIFSSYFDYFILRMNEIVRHFTPQEHHLHRNHFQDHLHPFLLLSPFVKRAYSKPLGYPGDYEMMNMLYGNHDQGTSLFARLVNRYSCQVTAGRAVMKRAPYILERIDRTIDRVSRHKESVSLMSIGCGPATEIQELIRANPMSDPCRVTLVDAEQEALHHCRVKISELKEATQSRISVYFLNRSIHQLILDPYLLNQLAGRDLIYAMGLFDYLPMPIAKRLLQKLHRLLSDKGELIIGNLDSSCDSRYFMEYAAEWYLIYRTPEEMMRLAEGIPVPVQASVEKDQTGTQLYLSITQDASPQRDVEKYSQATIISYGKA